MPYREGYQKSEGNPNGFDMRENALFFKREVQKNYYKTYLCDSIEDFNTIQKQSRNFYQVIRGDKPVREYYDFDMNMTEDEVKNFNDHEFLNKFISVRIKTLSLLQISNEFFRSRDDFIILTAHSSVKKSFHIYSKSTAFKNVDIHKQFTMEFNKHLVAENIKGLDHSVYTKNRLMRLIYNSKFGKDRPLIPFDEEKYSVADTLIELNPLNTTGRFNNMAFIDFNAHNTPPQSTDNKKRLLMLLNTPPPSTAPPPTTDNISKEKFMKNFLKANPWFQYDIKNAKLRRINDDIRRPCLVCPTADHGTENMTLNKYGNLFYLQCFQHTGKYLIPGQKGEEIGAADLTKPPFPKLDEKGYYWSNFLDDMEVLNRQWLSQDEYIKKILPQISKVLCYIIDLQGWMIRSSKKEPNQLQKKLPGTQRKCKFTTNEGKDKQSLYNFIKSLQENGLINEYDSRVFNPDPHFDENKENVVNTWSGFAAKEVCLESSNDLENILYHLKEVWCSGNLEQYEWLIECWFKPFFTNPHILTGVALFFTSDQGAGKNIIIDKFFIPFVFGKNISASINGVSKITQKHNTIVKDKIFINVNELPKLDINGRNQDIFDIIKSLITDQSLTVEPKGFDPYTIDNYVRYIFAGNHTHSLFLEKSDRRFNCLKVSNKHINDHPYFEKLAASFNQTSANLFFTYCIHFKPTIQGLNCRNPPVSDLKREIIINCSNSIDQMGMAIKEYLNIFNSTPLEGLYRQQIHDILDWPEWMRDLHYGVKNQKITPSDLYNIYQKFCKDNGLFTHSSIKFGNNFKNHFSQGRNSSRYYLIPFKESPGARRLFDDSPTMMTNDDESSTNQD